MGVAIYDDSGVNPFLSYTIVMRGVDWGTFTSQPAQTAGTTDDVTLAHFHQAAVGANGPAVFDWRDQDNDDFSVTNLHLEGGVPVATVQGVWERDPPDGPDDVDITGFTASFTSPVNVGDATDIYANVHTPPFAPPTGAARGQLVLLSTDNGETINGVAGVRDDILLGLGGDDRINGLDGNDTLDGGSGDDRLEGGILGNDTLIGGPGKDTLLGHHGNDIFIVAASDDVVGESYIGGGGADEFHVSGDVDFSDDSFGTIERLRFGGAPLDSSAIFNSSQRDIGDLHGLPSGFAVEGDAARNTIFFDLLPPDPVYGAFIVPISTFSNWTPPDDRIVIRGSDFDDHAFGSSQVDHIFGNAGDDTLNGLGGDDFIDGGAGSDTASYLTFTTGGVTAWLGNERANTADAAGDSYTSIENLEGTNSRDLLVGDNNANRITGFGGNDSLYGFGGNNTLRGFEGTDFLYSGADGDELRGGDGIDFARYDLATLTGVTVDLAGGPGTGEALGDEFFDVESVVGSNMADSLSGDDGHNELQGRGDIDSLDGRAGNDTLDGGAGADSLTGGAQNDTFIFVRTEAHGDSLVDFDGMGAAVGDRLIFSGYGAGATFTNINALQWQVNYAGGTMHDVITFANAAAIHTSDFAFV